MNAKNPQEVESGNAVERTVHFSDAVVAIAITLLTLELRLPEGLAPGEVAGHLLDALSGLFAFLVSFWVIASYWIAHHRIFNRVDAHDGTLLTINFVFLMWVVLVPFSTSMVMEYGDSRLVWDVYASHLLLTGLTLSWLWRYASKHGCLIEPNADLECHTPLRHTRRTGLGRACRVRALHRHVLLQRRLRAVVLAAPAPSARAGRDLVAFVGRKDPAPRG